jgi:hypothetical protein
VLRRGALFSVYFLPLVVLVVVVFAVVGLAHGRAFFVVGVGLCVVRIVISSLLFFCFFMTYAIPVAAAIVFVVVPIAVLVGGLIVFAQTVSTLFGGLRRGRSTNSWHDL